MTAASCRKTRQGCIAEHPVAGAKEENKANAGGRIMDRQMKRRVNSKRELDGQGARFQRAEGSRDAAAARKKSGHQLAMEPTKGDMRKKNVMWRGKPRQCRTR